MAEGEKCKRGSDKITKGASKQRKLMFGDDGKITFNEEELKTIKDFKRGVDYIEVGCGITNKTYGDFGGKLRINVSGQFSITCQCCPECTLENTTLEEFEKHAGKEGSGRWKSNIWVHDEDEDRVPLWKTPLMQYYTLQANVPNWIDHANRKRNHHRDEFIHCSNCNKERRFHLRTREEIKVYHAAANNKMWKCSDWPYQEITCDHERDRLSLKASRGCPRVSSCRGCPLCYCRGCIKCRFEDCNCRECRDFMLLAEP